MNGSRSGQHGYVVSCFAIVERRVGVQALAAFHFLKLTINTINDNSTLIINKEQLSEAF